MGTIFMFALGQTLRLEILKLYLRRQFWCIFLCLARKGVFTEIWIILNDVKYKWKMFKQSMIIFLLFTVFPRRSNLPQVKQNLRPNILNFSYELPKPTQDLGSQEIKRIFKHWVETQSSVPSPLQNLVFGNSFENLRQSRY